MAVKTITVTREAYDALSSLKGQKESFSEAIMRISKRRPLGDFYGVISKESGERLEKVIFEMRKARGKAHRERVKKIIKDLS